MQVRGQFLGAKRMTGLLGIQETIGEAVGSLQHIELMRVILARIEQARWLSRRTGGLRAQVRSRWMRRSGAWDVRTGRSVGHGVRLARHGPPSHAVAVGVVQASAGGPRAGVVCLGMRVPAGGGQYLEAAGEFVLVWGGVARWARLGYDDVGVGERGRTEAAGDRGPCRGSRGGYGR